MNKKRLTLFVVEFHALTTFSWTYFLKEMLINKRFK